MTTKVTTFCDISGLKIKFRKNTEQKQLPWAQWKQSFDSTEESICMNVYNKRDTTTTKKLHYEWKNSIQDQQLGRRKSQAESKRQERRKEKEKLSQAELKLKQKKKKDSIELKRLENNDIVKRDEKKRKKIKNMNASEAGQGIVGVNLGLFDRGVHNSTSAGQQIKLRTSRDSDLEGLA